MNFTNMESEENVTTMQLPHAEAHISYLIPMDHTSCSRLMDFDWATMCSFVTENTQCSELAWYIDWLDIIFCQLRVTMFEFAYMVVVMGTLAALCILALIIISYIRMAPCFIACANSLKLDEVAAGSIFLVFLSYFGDLVEDVNVFDLESATLYNQLLGTAIVNTTLFLGILGYRYQFHMNSRYFLRDSLFILFGVIFVNCIYLFEEVNWKFGVGFMFVYVAYVICVLSQFIVNRMRTGNSSDHHKITLTFKRNQENFQYGRELETPNKFIFEQFLTSIRTPISKEFIGKLSTFYQICFIIGFPIHVLTILTVPCFDYTLPNHGWSKLLGCINSIVIFPMMALVLELDSIVFYISWIFGVVLAVIVFFTSRTDRPPKYHLAFAFLGIATCVIYQATLEHILLNICNTFGHFLRFHSQTIGLSLLAWADNIALFVWITRLSAWGYHRTCFAALHMSSMLSLVFVLGLLITVKSWTSSLSFTPRKGVSGPTSAIYLVYVYIYILCGISLCKFQMRKYLGASLIIIYLVYITHNLLVEFEIIHGMGTDHAIKRYAPGVTWT